jgi:D-3-phosphoglycerate dehydrogenase / 2-oxoglutarate reductase
MYKILITDKFGEEGLAVLAAAADVQVDVKLKLSKEEIIAALPEYDAWIVRSGTRPDREMIAAGKRLKVIGRAGMGVDNIDVPAATEHGVIVMNTPGANSMATAEQTLALMLAASRHTAHAHKSLAAGEWNRNIYVGQELYGKTLGIIGFGRIGRLVATRAQAFGMHVLAVDPYVSEEDARQYSVTLVDLDELLPQVDYLTLHSAATAETAQMINATTLGQMKDGVILVNVARGKLIDEAALLAALESGKVAAAALDVFASEPPTGSPLVGHPKVTHTPHLGASSHEAQRNVSIEIAEQVVDALRGTGVRNAVNVPFDPSPNFAVVRPYLDLAEKLGLLQYHIANTAIYRVEIEVHGEFVAGLVRPIAASLLKGMIMLRAEEEVNIVNAPFLADRLGIAVAQTRGLSDAEYPNIIACRVYWGDVDGHNEQHIIAGTVHGGKHLRVVQFNRYYLEGNPEGIVMLMRNRDVPGVIGQIGTLLAAYNVNIGEWRLGRTGPGGEALSFINLDSEPPEQLLDAIRHIPAVVKAKVVSL